MASALREKIVDNRKYEQIEANAAAQIYERAITSEWSYRYSYLTTFSWGKRFNEPFLDFGCGTGLASNVLEKLGKQVTAFDLSRRMLYFAQKRCNVPLVLADALNLPFRDKVFSTTCIIGVLHHILNLEKAFDEISRCTKDTICINEPTPKPSIVMRVILFLIYIPTMARRTILQFGTRRPKSPSQKEQYHSKYERPLDPKKLIQLCEARGFTVTQLRYFNHIPRLHKFLSEKSRARLSSMLVSSKNGTDVEIIAAASSRQESDI
jgi:ubiquinone/menaquinone biosynthesis C-methylase UbiE